MIIWGSKKLKNGAFIGQKMITEIRSYPTSENDY